MTGSAIIPCADVFVAELERAVRGAARPTGGIIALACELLASNLRQWDLEDRTRDPAATDEVVAAAKRSIDQLNLARHDLVEEIDAVVDAAWPQSPGAVLATESPGMVLDRLSVLVIRTARTAAASATPGDSYAERLPVLRAQLAALTSAFDAYLDDLRAGRRRFMRYEHLKLYGVDPGGGAGEADA